jgi:hypothetical protein
MSLRHREYDKLKQEDNIENRGKMRNTQFLDNCQIVEKHLALSMLNNEKKNFL